MNERLRNYTVFDSDRRPSGGPDHLLSGCESALRADAQEAAPPLIGIGVWISFLSLRDPDNELSGPPLMRQPQRKMLRESHGSRRPPGDGRGDIAGR